MQRPALELADVIRDAGPSFLAHSRGWFTWLHLKVLVAILRCRTALLGGHVDACSRCGHQAIRYNSCRNRHCPRCQTLVRDRWIQARRRELLPTAYAHVVFTVHQTEDRSNRMHKGRWIYTRCICVARDALATRNGFSPSSVFGFPRYQSWRRTGTSDP